MTPEETGALVGRRVRRLRRERGTTIEDLASAADLHPNYVAGIERGERNPTVAVVIRIARALGVDPSSLFELHADEDARSLRREITQRLAKLPADELRRILRVLDALRG